MFVEATLFAAPIYTPSNTKTEPLATIPKLAQTSQAPSLAGRAKIAGKHPTSETAAARIFNWKFPSSDPKNSPFSIQ